MDPRVSAPQAHHDDVIKWKHFLRFWPLLRGIHRWPNMNMQGAVLYMYNGTRLCQQYVGCSWRHHMETFSALLAICAGIHGSPVNSPHKGQSRGALILSLICAWINGWVNNRDAGDLRHHHAHYDVTVMREHMHRVFSAYNNQHI